MTRTARRRWSREFQGEIDGIAMGATGPIFLHGYDPPAGGKWIDVLAVDKDGVLEVIEIKVGQDDNMLFQAIEYYDYVSVNQDRIAQEFSKIAKINLDMYPAIILLASGFSDRLRKAVRYFAVHITLLEYHVLKTAKGGTGLYCSEVPYEADAQYSTPASIDSVIEYITNKNLQTSCKNAVEALSKIGKHLEPRTAGRSEIRFKCKNRVVGGIQTRKDFFYVYW